MLDVSVNSQTKIRPWSDENKTTSPTNIEY